MRSAATAISPSRGNCPLRARRPLARRRRTRAEVNRLALDPVQGWVSRDEVRRLEDLPPESARAGAAPPVEAMLAAATNGNPNDNVEVS